MLINTTLETIRSDFSDFYSKLVYSPVFYTSMARLGDSVTVHLLFIIL